MEESFPQSQADIDALALTHGSKWGLQHMPTCRTLAHNLAILRAAAKRIGRPCYVFGNDVKDYFNHFCNAASELPLMNLVFLGESGDLSLEDQLRSMGQKGEHLIFVSEKRMGFGIHPNAQIAQDLSESLDYIFRTRMDKVEDAINDADPSHALQSWLSERRALEKKVGGHQRRLYCTLTYCDDNIVGVVGVEAAIRALLLRRAIEREAGLIMAIPKKRMLGTWGLWLGILVFSMLGMLVVPRTKLLKASVALQEALNARLPFDEYRSVIGLLEHMRHALCLPRRLMHGLYFPHGPQGEGQRGPCTIVRPNLFMCRQINEWLQLLARRAGAYFTSCFTRVKVHALDKVLTYFATSDAATDSDPPGMGGYMHGAYWYLPLTSEIVQWLHISVLELLATGFSTMVFEKLVPPPARLGLGADASATCTTFTRETESSEMLMCAHHAFLQSPRFCKAKKRTDLGHYRGASNLAADAVSRGLWDTFSLLCQNLRVRPFQV